MEFRKVVRDIHNLKIQGAETVAKEAVKALEHILNRSKVNNAKDLIKELTFARNELQKARPTEPCLRNALKYVMAVHRNDIGQLIRDLHSNIDHVQKYFLVSEKKIAEIGARRIPKQGVVFTNCHSTTVMMILAKAKFSRKSFEVHNTETRPKLQGRITAKELSEMNIKVFHFVDSAARYALKNSDIFFFGADAIQSDGRIINKIGTEMLLEVANKYDIPSYCCTVSWKFDPKTIFGTDEPIENRERKEVWAGAPKKVTIMNPAFEICDPGLITGVISEIGVYKPTTFVDEVRRTNPWMF